MNARNARLLLLPDTLEPLGRAFIANLQVLVSFAFQMTPLPIRVLLCPYQPFLYTYKLLPPNSVSLARVGRKANPLF